LGDIALDVLWVSKPVVLILSRKKRNSFFNKYFHFFFPALQSSKSGDGFFTVLLSRKNKDFLILMFVCKLREFFVQYGTEKCAKFLYFRRISANLW